LSVLSITSSVAYGYVGNAAVVPCLQALGVEAWPVHTTYLSNHPGHPVWRGGAVDAARLEAVIAGLDALGVLGRVRAVLLGYLPNPAIAEAAVAALARLGAVNPGAMVVCDPVMGDAEKGLYVPAPVAAAIADRLVPRADLITPNHFELEHLTGHRIGDLAGALAALEAVRGGGIAVGTSLTIDDDAGTVKTMAIGEGGAFLVTTPRLDTPVHGTGDALTGLLLGRLLAGESLAAALSHAVPSLHAVLEATVAAAADEMALVAARAAIPDPPCLFPAVAVG